jgi:hypothetical protein
MMMRVAELLDDQGAVNTTAGTASAFTLTASSSFTTLADGLIIGFVASVNSNASATINVNGLGARSLRRLVPSGDVAIAANDLVANQKYVAHYNTKANSNAGGWVVLNPSGVIPNESLSGAYTNVTSLTMAQAANTAAIIISGPSPSIKFTDTDSGADDFWAYVNGDSFYVRSDRTEAGSAQLPHPLQLNNTTSVGSIYGSTVWTEGNDGSSSGLDADLLDGQHGAYYLPAASYTASDVLTKIKTVDGAGSGLDADLLDGQTGAYYSNASNIATGTVPDARLPTRIGTVAKTITDWNNAQENGWYMGSAVTNAPSTAWYIGEVQVHRNDAPNGYVVQTVTGFTTASDSDSVTYRRYLQANVWTAWARLRISQTELDTRYVRSGATTTLTAGYPTTAVNDGTKSSGTYTPDPSTGSFREATNNGAHTLAPPTVSGSYTMVIDYTNGATAGAITSSGFTKVSGDTFTTTNGNKFRCYISKGGVGTHLHIQAMQ